MLVRADLSRSQQAVQAGHAVAEACLKGKLSWGNGTLVYLKVRDLNDLLFWYEKVGKAFPFHEPDLNNEMTAFAVEGPAGLFPQLKLL